MTFSTAAALPRERDDARDEADADVGVTFDDGSTYDDGTGHDNGPENSGTASRGRHIAITGESV